MLSTLTAPLVVEGVNTSQGRKNLIFLVGSDDTVFALDADTGKTLWQKTFPNNLTPRQAATWLCSDTQNATPVIDKQKSIIYLNTSDGKLRGLSLSDGEDRIAPTDFVIPFARNWSLNLIDDVIYSPTARGCGGAMANISAMAASDPTHLRLSGFTRAVADRRALGGEPVWCEVRRGFIYRQRTRLPTRHRELMARRCWLLRPRNYG